ncbi:uncharacterized protein LOC143853821 isoform X2 [Tasmannia lanceolata]|uniref:uncharacterized protein LOC143853821 isoform X2 n=1 Tax=Tasmannia lanceolata TaxID=3420 RepID=UPI004064690D
MVFYFKARSEAGDYTIFMGLDKHENEELIRYGFPEDIWFHVDKMSSAHVYVRLNKGQTIDDISEGLLEDCAQLVKANSIQGNKVNNIDVVYTPWYNLKKTPSMDVGQVGFHNPKMKQSYSQLPVGDRESIRQSRREGGSGPLFLNANIRSLYIHNLSFSTLLIFFVKFKLFRLFSHFFLLIALATNLTS